MSKIKSFLDFTGLSELFKMAIRELSPNMGQNDVIRVHVYDQKYPPFHKNKIR